PPLQKRETTGPEGSSLTRNQVLAEHSSPLPSWERGMEARSQAFNQKQPYKKAKLSPLSQLGRGAGGEGLDSQTTHEPSEPAGTISQCRFIPPFVKGGGGISAE